VRGAFGVFDGVQDGAATGVFRSPAAVPAGRIVVSCDPTATNVRTGPFHWDLCQLDTVAHTVAPLGGAAGLSDVEAVAVYPRVSHGVFQSKIDEVNGHTAVRPGEDRAQIHVHDFPLLATLLFANTRSGRPIDPAIGGFNVYEAHPPPTSATSFADLGDQVVTDDYGQVFVDYRSLGFVPTRPDGSARFSVPGGAPILLEATDHWGRALQFPETAELNGPMRQREQMQFYPGEHANQSIQRQFFDGLCGGCHGSVTGRELNIAVDVDVLTSASRTQSYDDAPLDLFR
jgi:hypothetical protein